MEEDIVAMVQAYRLGRLLRQAGLLPRDVWSRSVRAGGTVGEHEVEAYVHSALTLPAEERDALARAANELTAHLGLMPAPCSDQLWGRIRLSAETRLR
ncbi:hypothetical protein GMA12_08255 [Kocuria sediminis]|uniref:Uncharacterized protein n=1 Tax=Kocuria sediminis TaxID=1038857 RepID=A0A6N8GLK7_9MICC|nr:hypothetical protein [Kocuria sediminis]MUN63130.1 hypothetical protein [Kocuria sediminis]